MTHANKHMKVKLTVKTTINAAGKDRLIASMKAKRITHG